MPRGPSTVTRAVGRWSETTDCVPSRGAGHGQRSSASTRAGTAAWSPASTAAASRSGSRSSRWQATVESNSSVVGPAENICAPGSPASGIGEPRTVTTTGSSDTKQHIPSCPRTITRLAMLSSATG